MRHVITTSTGSVYEIDTETGIAKKNGHSFKYGKFMATPDWYEDRKVSLETKTHFDLHEWVDVHGTERLPQAGDCLYILGFKEWYLSTPIREVETIE